MHSLRGTNVSLAKDLKTQRQWWQFNEKMASENHFRELKHLEILSFYQSYCFSRLRNCSFAVHAICWGCNICNRLSGKPIKTEKDIVKCAKLWWTSDEHLLVCCKTLTLLSLSYKSPATTSISIFVRNPSETQFIKTNWLQEVVTAFDKRELKVGGRRR